MPETIFAPLVEDRTPKSVIADSAVWSLLQFCGTAFLQAFCGGAVTVALASHSWTWAFVSCLCLNLLWWNNVGQRIDRHKERWSSYVYATMVALGTVAGAWFWVWKFGSELR